MIKSRRVLTVAMAIATAVVSYGCGSDQPQVTKDRDGKLLYPKRSEEFTKATKDFGALIVKPGQVEFGSEKAPWSSWWFPSKETYLFRAIGEKPAPLQKYDAYAKKRGNTTYAARYEEEELWESDANNWEGLCHAWAMASIVEPEPRRAKTAEGIVFDVGDQKALLIKTYEETNNSSYYGQRYDAAFGSVFEDVYADQFHRVLQTMLVEQGRPFIIDKEPGVQVWSIPIYEGNMKIETDAADPRIFHVTVGLNGASPFVDRYDYVGTLPLTFEYTYDLYGKPQDDGSLLVEYGTWTGTSRDYHPDFVTVPGGEGEIQHRSRNKHLSPSIVYEIVKGGINVR